MIRVWTFELRREPLGTWKRKRQPLYEPGIYGRSARYAGDRPVAGVTESNMNLFIIEPRVSHDSHSTAGAKVFINRSNHLGMIRVIIVAG